MQLVCLSWKTILFSFSWRAAANFLPPPHAISASMKFAFKAECQNILHALRYAFPCWGNLCLPARLRLVAWLNRVAMCESTFWLKFQQSPPTHTRALGEGANGRQLMWRASNLLRMRDLHRKINFARCLWCDLKRWRSFCWFGTNLKVGALCKHFNPNSVETSGTYSNFPLSSNSDHQC
jgi:hypothetical protein